MSPYRENSLHAEAFKYVVSEARRLFREDGNEYQPGFSTRVKAIVLNRLAELHGERTTAHVEAVNSSWTEFSKRNRRLSRPKDMPPIKQRLRAVG